VKLHGLRPGGRLTAAVLVGIAGMLLFVNLFGTTTFLIFGLEVQVSLATFAGGTTEIAVPPIGSIRAHTHLPPVLYRLELRSVDLSRLRYWIDQLGSPGIGEEVAARVQRLVRQFVLRTLAVGALGSTALLLALGVRRPRYLLTGLTAGLLVLVLLLGLSLSTYDPAAFKQPQFTGVIAAAPWVVNLADEAVARFREFDEQLQVLTSNLYRLFASIQQVEALGTIQSDRKLLIVSDIHNNPAAFSLLARVVTTFRPDLIIDAGDITDYGTEFEAAGLRRLGSLGIPYILAPGNHDSPAVLDQLAQLPNVIVLANSSVTIKDVRIFGVADPSSRLLSPELPTAAEIQGRIIATRHALDTEGPPFILVAHHPEIVRPFFEGEAGRVPVVISGHTHRLRVVEGEDSVWIDPGTTGAAGIRGLTSRTEIPYTLVLLYLRRLPAAQEGAGMDSGIAGTGWEAVAVDTVRISNLEGSFTIERRLLGPARTATENMFP